MPNCYKYLEDNISKSITTRNSLREESNNINEFLQDLVTQGSWNNWAGDIAPVLITQIPSWPKNKQLVIENNGKRYFFPERRGDQSNSLRLRLNNNHYTLLTDENELSVASDGDCFYQAILMGLTPEERARLLGQHVIQPVSTESVQRLRELVAEYALEHAATLYPYIQRENAGYSQSEEPDMRGERSTQPKAGKDWDHFFSYLRKAHLQEALEFRRKGYNSQMPEVDPNLIIQLCEAVTVATSRISLQPSVTGPLGSEWQLKQIQQIKSFADWLSYERTELWVNDAVVSTKGSNISVNRGAAQSMVRRFESILRTLLYIVDLLLFIDEHNTPEKRRNMLITEVTDALANSNKDAVWQAVKKVTTDTANQEAWSSLIQYRETTWEAEQWRMVGSVADIIRREAKKASKKANSLSGESQTFFCKIQEYFQNLTSDLAEASVNVTPGTSLQTLQKVNNKEVAAILPRSNSFWQNVKTRFVKKKKESEIVAAVWAVWWLRFSRAIEDNYPTKPLKKPEEITTDSVIRSILWQWQQIAIKIQRASGALLAKLNELQKIEGVLLSEAAAQERENREGDGDISNSELDEADIDAQVRQWIYDTNERENPQKQQAAKAAVLEQLLASDIDYASKMIVRLGRTEKDIEDLLMQQQLAVMKMIVERPPAVAPSLESVNKLLPDIARNLTRSIAVLANALEVSRLPARDFAKAKVMASNAQLRATKVKERLSLQSELLTERMLDEYSRRSRLAKHWARLAKENIPDSDLLPDVDQIYSLLKKHGLLDAVISAGDPNGYHFATMFAGELENAYNNELILPMSPEQCAAIEKGLINYAVQWAQRRVSHGIARIIVKLSFEQSMDTITLSLFGLVRIPYKVLKSSIKIPYKINRMNKHIMPGQDKSFKAINDMLNKKLKQLGFSLIMTPIPGLIKLALGIGTTTAAVIYNRHTMKKEEEFTAVYERVAEGKKSEVLKMTTPSGMLFHFFTDGGIMVGYKTVQEAMRLGGSKSVFHYDINSLQESNTGIHSQLQSYIDQLDDERNPKVKARSKRESPDALSNITLDSDHHNFDHSISYQNLTDDMKIQSYYHSIQFVLYQIEHDKEFSPEMRHRAKLARHGAPYLVPVDIKGYKLNNTLLLPYSTGSRAGIIICLDSETPYYGVYKGVHLSTKLKPSMPHNSDYRKPTRGFPPRGPVRFLDSALDVLDKLIGGEYSLYENFNDNKPTGMSIENISHFLFNTSQEDYRARNIAPQHKTLMARAVAGAHIDDGITVKPLEYHIEFTWGKLTPAEYLRSFARPFTTFSGDLQLIFSSLNGDTIDKTEHKVHQAEYIGSWFDATTGAVTTFTPAGWVLDTVKSIASISADVTEGNNPDPLSVAALILGSIPGEKIAAKIAKSSAIGGEVVKYILILGNKSIDLAVVGESIKLAIETGEPLAIYQALLNSGLSVKDSYHRATYIANAVKTKHSMEESASLADLEALHSNAPKYALGSKIPAREFIFGTTRLLGKIDNNKIQISSDNGVTWQSGTRVHLLAFRLQNAGGGRKFHVSSIGGLTFQSVDYDKEKFTKMESIRISYAPAPVTDQRVPRVKKAKDDYQKGKAMSNKEEYNIYDGKTFKELVDLFIAENTSPMLRGVLAEKMKPYIKAINLYEHAEKANEWAKAAKKAKAKSVVSSSQSIFLTRRDGKCLPLSVLMGRALQSGQDKNFSQKLMGIYLSPDIANDPLYKLIAELHTDGKSSEFNGKKIPDIKESLFLSYESKFFPADNSFVRVDIPEHTMLLAKVVREGNVIYVFYDPNYGLAYFDKYSDMINFFKDQVSKYEKYSEETTNYFSIDYKHHSEIKISGKNLDEIINIKMPHMPTSESAELPLSESALPALHELYHRTLGYGKNRYYSTLKYEIETTTRVVNNMLSDFFKDYLMKNPIARDSKGNPLFSISIVAFGALARNELSLVSKIDLQIIITASDANADAARVYANALKNNAMQNWESERRSIKKDSAPQH